MFNIEQIPPNYPGMVQAPEFVVLDHNYILNLVATKHRQAEHSGVNVQHCRNREIILSFNLFHETDDFNLRDGHINRHSDATMLFGRRYNR